MAVDSWLFVSCYQCPMPCLANALFGQCPMPHAPCPMPHALFAPCPMPLLGW
ncbi:hypothetical protein QUB03_02650 [Microcoleus sp. F6_B5]